MQTKRLNVVLIIIIILLVGIIGNFIKKDYLNKEKIILKAMTETEYEDYITSLNQSHIDYANYIQESKTKIASAITDMGITTSNEEILENMASNIRNIARDASSISYDNTSSGLTSTNVQRAVDEVNNRLIGFPDMSNVIHAMSDWKTEFSWTVPEDCWVFANLNTNKSSVSSYVKVNDKIVTQILGNSADSLQLGALFPCKKGDVISKQVHGNTQARFTAYGIR